MNSVKEWVFSQLLTKSLTPSLPFAGINRFSHEEQPHEGLDNADSTDATDLDASQVPPDRSPSCAQAEEPQNDNLDRGKPDSLSKIDDLQIKFLHILKRTGHSYDDLLVAKVLYRMNLATLIRAGEADSRTMKLKHDRTRAIAAREEASANGLELNFSCRVLLLGRTGVGKSATINSIFGQEKAATDAFQPSTNQIQEISGTLGGMKISFIDTPGFSPSSASNLRRNRKIMVSVKRYIRRSPPDIVLFFERLDDVSMIHDDLPLLKLMSEVFGSSIWFNAILVMTHASCVLPEGYESHVSQCFELIQQLIHQSVSDSTLVNPVLLVENHPQCKRNPRGEKILPSGESWVSQLLLLCLCTKVLNDTNNLLGFRGSILLGPTRSMRQPSLPHLLSSLLRNRPEQSTNGIEEEIVNILLSETDEEEEEYDQLPSFRVLSRSKFKKLSESQKRDYLDELDYRETLFLRKQLKNELRTRAEQTLEAATEPYLLPDMAVPPSFDSYSAEHRYRSLVTSEQFVARPVLDPHGWDHDVGFDGINLDTSFELHKNVSCSVTGQLSKDKNSFSIHSESALAYKSIKAPTCSLGLDVQSSGEDLICTIKSNMKLNPLKHNAADIGVSLTSFGNKYYASAMIEDQIYVGKSLKFVVNGGRIGGGEKAAYAGNFGVTLRGRDYPVRTDHVGVKVTVLSFDKDTVIGAGLDSEFRVGRGTRMSVSANLNNRKLGQICIKTSSSDHLEIAVIALLSIFKVLCRRKKPKHLNENE